MLEGFEYGWICPDNLTLVDKVWIKLHGFPLSLRMAFLLSMAWAFFKAISCGVHFRFAVEQVCEVEDVLAVAVIPQEEFRETTPESDDWYAVLESELKLGVLLFNATVLERAGGWLKEVRRASGAADSSDDALLAVTAAATERWLLMYSSVIRHTHY